jgi:hypothetical protein
VYVPAVLTEAAYSTALHEFGHCASAAADSHQHRHAFSANNSIVAPVAEEFSWRWVVDHALIFTELMQLDLVDALGTYRRLTTTTSDEAEGIDAFMQEAAARVRPAPDTLAGRELRVQQIRREDKARAIRADLDAHGGLSVEKAMRRLYQAGVR